MVEELKRKHKNIELISHFKYTLKGCTQKRVRHGDTKGMRTRKASKT